MNDAGSLRATQFNPAIHYDIGQINFYVSNKIYSNRTQVFLIMKDSTGVYDIVELVKVASKNTGVDILFRLALEQPIRIKDDNVELSLLLLDGLRGTYKMSTPYKMFIFTKNYNIARQVYISQQVGATVQEYYNRIISLAEKLLEEGDNNL